MPAGAMPHGGEGYGSRHDSSSAGQPQGQPRQQQQQGHQGYSQEQPGQQLGLHLASGSQPQHGGLEAAGQPAGRPASGKHVLPAATLPLFPRQEMQYKASAGRGIPAAPPAAANGGTPAPAAQPTYQAPPHLLSLPDAALCYVLRHLTAAGDLARCAAACRALRELTKGLSWAGVTLLEAHLWGPGVAAGLRWVAERCPGILRVDLGGMGPCGEAELEALLGLKAVRELSLRDCWHFQGVSLLELELVQSLPCLTSLDLSGTGALLGGVSLLRALPSKMRELKMARMLPGPTADVFPSLMLLPSLVSLDFSSNPWITSTHIEQLVRLWDLNLMMAQMGGGGAAVPAAPAPAAAPAAAAAAGQQGAAGGPSHQTQQVQQPAQRRRSVAMDRWPRLRRLSFRGCEQLGGLGQLFARHPGLTHVDVSGTATCDADVEVLAESCEALASLDVSGCVRFKGPALCALSRSAAVHSGSLTELRLGDLPWVKPQNLMQILGALSEWNALCQAGPVKLDLSHCGGLNDTSLLELLPWEDEEGGSGGPSPSQPTLYASQQQQQQHANRQPQQPRSSGRVKSRLRWLRWPGSSSSSSGGSGRSRGGRSSSASSGSLVGTPDSSAGLGRLSRGSSSQGPGGSPSAGSAGSIVSSAAASPVAGGLSWATGGSEVWEGPLRFEELSIAGASRLSTGAVQQLAEWRPWGAAPSATGAVSAGPWTGEQGAGETDGRPRVEGGFQPGRVSVPGNSSSGRLSRRSSTPGPASKWLSSMLGRASTGSASASAAAAAAAGTLPSRQPSGPLTLTSAATSQPPGEASSSPLSPCSSQVLAHSQPGRPCLPSFSSGSLLCTLLLLDVSHCECFRSSSPGGRAALGALFEAAGPALRTLRLDGCHVGGGVLGLLAQACPGLEELSVVGCKGATNDDFLALAGALCTLRSLAVGGAVMSWREDVALAAFTGLRSLRIARRSFLSDQQLLPTLAAIAGLKELALASCPSLTDASLEALPRRVEQLHLVCCERLTGAGLQHLRSLRSLKFSGCPAITEAAVQHIALSCPHLTMLELPSHIRPDCLPVAAPTVVNHLRGLQVVGGLAEPAGGGGLGRRWRQRGSRRSSAGGGG